MTAHLSSRMRLVRLAWIAFLLVACAALADSGTDIFLAKGFQPNQAYHLAEFDSVNTMNGNLTVRVPLGGDYKTNGTLKYAFSLVYNGDFWYYIHQPAPVNTTPLGPEGRNFSTVVRALDGGPGAASGTEAVPSGQAGVGWDLGLPSYGESAAITDRIAAGYNDWSGASHLLQSEMHRKSELNQNPSDPDVSYSTDATYYRVRRGAPGADSRPTREVQTPDGLLSHFTCAAPVATDCSVWGKNQYVLDWIADPYGNVLLIERLDDANHDAPMQPAFGKWKWKFIEGTLPNAESRSNPYYSGTAAERNNLTVIRTHWLFFDRVNPNNANETQPELRWQTRLTKAVLSAFGGTTAVYTPQYKLKKILRPPVFPYDCQYGASPCDTLRVPYNADKSISVYVLDSIDLPGDAGNWKFDYYSGELNDNKATFAAFDKDIYRGGDPGTSADNNPYCCKSWPLKNDRNEDVVLAQGDPGTTQPNVPTFYYEWRLPDGHGGTIIYPTSKIGGRMRKVFAPTGGGYRYTYGLRAFPTNGCHPAVDERLNHPAVLMTGIATRLEIDQKGNAVGNPWVYSGSAFRAADFCATFNGDFIAGVLEPNGKLTLSFFNVKPYDPLFGAPISPVETRASYVPDAPQRNLSSRVYAVDYAAYSPDLHAKIRALLPRYGGTGDPDAHLLRSTWATYTMSSSSCGQVDSDSYCEVFNLRKTAELETYDDEDPGAYVEQLYSDYDGLGNFRKIETYSNFRNLSQPNVAPLEYRVVFQSFNPAVTFSGTANPANLPATNKPWITTNFGHMTRWQDGQVTHARYFFDPERGFLAAKRSVVTHNLATKPGTLAESELSVTAKDFLVTYERQSVVDASSKPRVNVWERNYGGTNASASGVLGTSWLANGEPATNGASPEYKLLMQYQFGALAKTEYYNTCGDIVLQQSSAVIDQDSGLPSALLDSSAAQTNYLYDGVGRVTRVTPPGETAQTYQYSLYSENVGRNSVIVDRIGGASYDFEYDHMGRMTTESHTIPGDSAGSPRTTHRFYAYSVFGTPLYETVWSFASQPTDSAPKRRTFTYDALNRVTKTVAPDTTVTTTSYKGERQVDIKTEDVALVSGSATWLTHSYDGLRRMSEASDGVLHARYDYDAGDRIRTVELNPVGAQSPVQTRNFIYDGAGNLLFEEHPELAGYFVSHEKIDARGHAHKLAFREGTGPNAEEDVSRGQLLDFDPAERPTAVKATATNSLLKEFHYYGLNCNNCTGVEKTRLEWAKRYNAVVNPAKLDEGLNVVVTDTFHYNPATGRPISVETMANGTATGYTFNMAGKSTYAYDALGQLTTVGYPTDATNSIGPLRTVTNVYDQSMLTQVKQTAPSAAQRATIVYTDPTGIPTKVKFGPSTVFDETIVDATGMPRIGRIEWNDAGGVTKFGDYFYDGLGNIKRIDHPGQSSDTFRYDQAGRLANATVSGKEQTYSYDAFGNLLSFNTYHPRSFLISSATNRLVSDAMRTAVYDASGNLTRISDLRPNRAGRYVDSTFDALNAMTRIDTGVATPSSSEDLGRVFLYNASDERVAVIDYRHPSGIRELWSFRDLGNHVLRDLERTTGSPGWTWLKDYTWRGATLNTTLAPSAQGEAAQDAHTDHLGTIRRVTDATGQAIDTDRAYMPFGDPQMKRPLTERLAFTGHERDDFGSAGPEADLDYMHARYYSAWMGRFLSVDPARDVDAKHPQSWNLYAYVMNNPINAFDSDGRVTQLVVGGPTKDNVFGHVSIAINGLVYSYGTSWVKRGGDWGVPLSAYLAAQATSRETTILTLKVTPQQEAALEKSLTSQRPDLTNYDVTKNSCVTVCDVALQSQSITEPHQAGPEVVDQAGNSLQAGSDRPLKPATLAAQVQQQGLVTATQQTGEPVGTIRALWGTIKSAVGRLTR